MRYWTGRLKAEQSYGLCFLSSAIALLGTITAIHLFQLTASTSLMAGQFMLTTVAVSVAVYLLYCPVCGIACTIVAQGHLICDCCAEQLLVQPCKV